MTDPLLTIAQACGLFHGERPSKNTVYRWMIKGVGRSRVRLWHKRTVRGLMTTAAAIAEFEKKRTEMQSLVLRATQKIRSVADARHAHEASMEILRQRGLCS